MSGAFNPEVFRTYDVRGRVSEDLTEDFVRGLGRAYGTTVRRAGGARIALGRDCRLSGPSLSRAFERGVRAAGVDVLDVGLVPTPVLYFAVHQFEVQGGVVITGSHNPPEWNGLKMMLGTDGLYGEDLQGLRRLMETGDLESGAGASSAADALTPYRSHILDDIRPGPRATRVVVDAGNGTAGLVVGDLYRALGFEVIELYCEPDGRFPNHHPDPTVEANLVDLRRAVSEHQADLGLAFDGDSDRLGAVDAAGRVAWGDQLLLFFARDILTRRPGARIVGEVKCSRTLFEGIAAAGGEPEMWKVGHSLIKARMKETGALLAGEMSGHLFFADRYFGFDDAIYAGARLLEMLSRGGPSLGDMLSALPPSFTTPELRVSCPDAAKVRVVMRAAEHFGARYPVNTLDGIRVDFEHGWGLLRPSNTQPVLVLRFEADSAHRRDAYRAEVEGWLRTHAPEVDLDADTHR